MTVDARIRASALVVAVLLAAGAAGAADRELSLEEAIGHALQKNESIVVEKESLVAARAAESGARSIYDPDLKVEGGWNRATTPVNSTFSGAPAGKSAPTNTGTDFAASVEQLLPTGGVLNFHVNGSRQTSDGTFSLLSPAFFPRVGVELRQPLEVLWPRRTSATKFRVRVARLDREGAQAAVRRQIADTVATVERAYWTLAAARREVSVRAEAVKLAEEQRGDTDARVEQGMAAEAERAQPRAELERRRGEWLASREAASRADNALKVLILGENDDELWASSFVTAEATGVEPLEVQLDAWMQKALASRPELEIAKTTLGRRKLEASLAHDQVRPSVEAVAGYDRLGMAGTRNPALSLAPGSSPPDLGGLEGGLGRSIGTLTDGGFSNARLSVTVSMPLFNREAKAKAAIADTVENQAASQLAQARKTVRAEVLDAAAAVQTAEQRIAAAKAAREAAEVQFSAERDRFTAGLSTNFLVLTRQNELSQARLDEIASVHDYRNARTELARATGSLLEERRIAVEEK